MYDVFESGADAALRHGIRVPLNDPLAVVSLMAQAKMHLGFGVTCALTYEHPFSFPRYKIDVMDAHGRTDLKDAIRRIILSLFLRPALVFLQYCVVTLSVPSTDRVLKRVCSMF